VFHVTGVQTCALPILAKGYYPVSEELNPIADLALDLEQLNAIVRALQQDELEVPLDDLGRIHQRWQAEFLAGQAINSARLLIARSEERRVGKEGGSRT